MLRRAIPAPKRSVAHALRQTTAASSCATPRRLFSAATAQSQLPQLKRGEGCKALQVGDVYHNFELKRVATVPEYNIDALELEHVRTKAQYLHIDAKDSNNVFAVMFRTPPASSNGVPHILEHTVLCGSQKFPVRDPFFNMIKRSLNTYMNALTGCDHTMYPFSTTNEKDWKNLLAVYLDAAFFPNLHKYDFLQEGHRLEIAESEEAGGEGESELVYKGVVFNEMKGVMSDSNNIFGTRLQQKLLDGTIYGHVSGGDPRHIPELTYEELRAFHAKHYHPSNACFYSYGDLPLTDHLQYLDEQILRRFEYRADSAATRVDSAPFDIFMADKTKPTELQVIEGPSSNMTAGEVDPNTKFCMSKFVNIASTDPFDTFVMRIVGYLLTNGPSSPLYKALIDSNLAQDFSIGTGFDTSTYYSTFGVGVEGIEGESSIPAIQEAVQKAYEEVLEHGFEKERVDGLLHQLELSLKHIVGNFGLTLMHGSSSVWTHRGDLIENLQLNPILTKLDEEMKRDPRFLESYVRDYIMPNDTKEVHLLMKPKESYVEDQELRERQTLAALLSEKTNADLDRIAHIAKELEKHQQKPQPVDCLPTLTLADIPLKEDRNFDFVDVHPIGKNGTNVEFVRVPTTNEISYLRLMFDITDSLPLTYQLYLPLFTTVFGSLGTSQLPYDVLPTVIQNCSGGISCSAISNPSLVDARSASKQSVLLGSMCLPHKIDETLQILYSLMTDTQFLQPENLNQLRILIQMSAANASNSISSSGASLASTRSRLGLTHSSVYHELYGGLTQIEQLQKWSQCSDDELRELAVILQEIAQLVFVPENLRLSVVTEEKLRTQVAGALEKHLVTPLEANAPSISPRTGSLLASDPFVVPSLASSKSYFGFPISVNFNVKTLPSVSFAHPDHVPLSVLAQMMSSCYLHQQVREQGGAYGSGVSQGEGYFSLSSHYDPNTWKTLTAYENTLKWAADGSFSDRDVQEALLSIFSSIDAPKTPSSTGRMTFLRGITNEMRQARREQYLQLQRRDLVDVAQKYFVAPAQTAGNTVIVGKEGAMKEFEDRGFAVKQFSTSA
ncbi:Metalloprotease family m16c, partial [Globisporangium splendens]